MRRLPPQWVKSRKHTRKLDPETPSETSWQKCNRAAYTRATPYTPVSGQETRIAGTLKVCNLAIGTLYKKDTLNPSFRKRLTF